MTLSFPDTLTKDDVIRHKTTLKYNPGLATEYRITDVVRDWDTNRIQRVVAVAIPPWPRAQRTFGRASLLDWERTGHI